jgi:hypothetical protein
MKQFLFIVLLAVSGTGLVAQDIKKIKELLGQNALDKAKESIDQFLANPKNQKNAEGWYVKGKIYGQIAATENFKSLAPDGRMDALEAIKKANSIDSNQTAIYLTLDKYMPVYNLYTGYFDVAASLYNGEKYSEALETFKKTAQVGEYIHSRGWGLYKLDTTLTYYTALSAMNAKKEDEAIVYFAKLADARVASAPEQVTSYRYLAKHYYDKKDEANMNKYIKLGRELYPNDDYLPLLELDFVREKGDKVALFKKYEEILQATPNNFDVLVEYANELFNETHVTEASKKPANYAENCAKIESLYKKAMEVKPEHFEVPLSLGKHYYNQALIVEDEAAKIKGAKPEDVKKKADLKAEVAALSEKAIEPLEKTFNAYDAKGKLKVSEKSNFKSACNLLAYCYNIKKDKAKADFYQKKYDEADSTH